MEFGKGFYQRLGESSSQDDLRLEKFKVISFDRPQGRGLAFASTESGGGGGIRAAFGGQEQVNGHGGIRGEVKKAGSGWLEWWKTRRWLRRTSRPST